MVKNRRVYISESTVKKIPASIDSQRLETCIKSTFTEKSFMDRLESLQYTQGEIKEILKYVCYYLEDFSVDIMKLTKEKQAMEDFLKENPDFINTQFLPEGKTLLHMVSGYDTAEYLIKQGADVNARDFHGNTPLHVTYNPYIAELLISSGADIKAENKAGSKPDTCQESRGNYEIEQAAYDRDGEGNVYGKMALIVAEAIRAMKKEMEKE
ncbi:MAG: ankyrin repeat domain-containing protein [Candidatus Eremiobacterota bacterium]